MRCKLALAALLLTSNNLQLATAQAQGTAFTYQGRLNDGAGPANGTYDFKFAVYDSADLSARLVGGPVVDVTTVVSNGLFTALVDFGGVYNSGGNWLEIAVSTNGANAFTTLSPRQQLTPVPYAVTAANLSGTVDASQLTGVIPAAWVSGTLTAAQLPAEVMTNGASGVIISGTYYGSGYLTNLSVSSQGNVPALTLIGNNDPFTHPAANFLYGNPADRYRIAFMNHDQWMNSALDINGQANWDAYGQMTHPSDAFDNAVGWWSLGPCFTIVPDTFNAMGITWGTTPPNVNSNWWAYLDEVSVTEENGYTTPSVNYWRTMGGDIALRQLTFQSNFAPSMAFSWTNAAAGLQTNAWRLTPDGSNNIVAMFNNGGTQTNTYPVLTPTGIPASSLVGTGSFTGAFTGDGGGLTNLNIANLTGTIPPASLPGAVVTNKETGVTLSGSFSGNGAGLTNLDTANLSGTIPPANLPGTVVTNKETGVTLSGSFSGNGSGLTNLGAVVYTGTISLTNLPGAVVTNNETGVALSGSFSGNGSGLTNLGAVIYTGTISLTNLPGSVVTNNETGVALSGSFSGNGSGLANLNAASLNGAISIANFPTLLVTNFGDATGPLPATYKFTTTGGRLLISTSGSGYASTASTFIGMSVKLDTSVIGYNRVWANNSIHMAFVPKTFVVNNVAPGLHTLVLATISGTTSTVDDIYCVTVQELPY